MRGRFIFYPSSILVLSCLFFTAIHAGTTGKKKKTARPEEYGDVLVDNRSSLANTVKPVVFRHWLHRARYTCRLCHVDVGFAMAGGETGITCEDVKNGIYCGACHDGGEAFPPAEKKLAGEVPNCVRCHSYGETVEFSNDFSKFRRKMPKERFGNRIDWQKAEEEKIIEPKDYLKNVSIRQKKPLRQPKELEVSTGEDTMPDIIFSHKKHAVWSGCELCHPDLFGVTRGDTVYSMKDIFEDKFCGACHGIVAFPNNDCQRCHTKDVN